MFQVLFTIMIIRFYVDDWRIVSGKRFDIILKKDLIVITRFWLTELILQENI